MRQIAFIPLLGVLLYPGDSRGYQAGPAAFLRDSEVYARVPGSAEIRQLTKDGTSKRLLVQSRSGNRLAFIRESAGGEMADILVMRPDGTGLREIHFRPPEVATSGMRSVEELAWLSEARLLVSGSLNPSTGEYAVVDADSGKQLASYLVDGSNFEGSPDGTHVAYVGYVPHFTPEERRRPQICLDDECRFSTDPPQGYPDFKRHVEFRSKPTWAPDSSAAAIVAEDYETQASSVIVRPVGGKPIELSAPDGANAALEISWSGKVLVVRSGARRWKLEPGSVAWIADEK